MIVEAEIVTLFIDTVRLCHSELFPSDCQTLTFSSSFSTFNHSHWKRTQCRWAPTRRTATPMLRYDSDTLTFISSDCQTLTASLLFNLQPQYYLEKIFSASSDVQLIVTDQVRECNSELFPSDCQTLTFSSSFSTFNHSHWKRTQCRWAPTRRTATPMLRYDSDTLTFISSDCQTLTASLLFNLQPQYYLEKILSASSDVQLIVTDQVRECNSELFPSDCQTLTFSSFFHHILQTSMEENQVLVGEHADEPPPPDAEVRQCNSELFPSN